MSLKTYFFFFFYFCQKNFLIFFFKIDFPLFLKRSLINTSILKSFLTKNQEKKQILKKNVEVLEVFSKIF